MSIYFVLIFMFFCHIVDDFYLQGKLADYKQRSWWEKNYPDKLYRLDYAAAGVLHAVKWAFAVMLPIAIYQRFNVGLWFLLIWAANVVIHAVVDDLKANKRRISLCADQTAHIWQICVTWFLLCVVIKGGDRP